MMGFSKLVVPGYVPPVVCSDAGVLLREVASLVQPRTSVPIRVVVEGNTSEIVASEFYLKTVL
jgi:hypothetical protein